MEGFSPFYDSERVAHRRGGCRRGPRSRPLAAGIVVDKSCRVYITNIPLSRIEAEGGNALRSEFERFGPIEAYRLFTDRSGRYVGSAMCTYLNDADAALAVHMVNDKEIEPGIKLSVSISKDHGVILLQQNKDARSHFIHDPQTPFTSMNGGRVQEGGDDARWVHDKYELLEKGEDMDAIFGIKRRHIRGRERGRTMHRSERGGRGRGTEEYNRPLSQEEVEKSFEEYVRQRDEKLGEKTTTEENVIPGATPE